MALPSTNSVQGLYFVSKANRSKIKCKVLSWITVIKRITVIDVNK